MGPRFQSFSPALNPNSMLAGKIFLLRWATCKEVKQHFPKSFKKYPDARVITDATRSPSWCKNLPRRKSDHWCNQEPISWCNLVFHLEAHILMCTETLRFLQSTRRSFLKNSDIYIWKKGDFLVRGSYSSSISIWMLGMAKHLRLWQVIRSSDFYFRFPSDTSATFTEWELNASSTTSAFLLHFPFEDVCILLSWRKVRNHGNFGRGKYCRFLSPSSSDVVNVHDDYFNLLLTRRNCDFILKKDNNPRKQCQLEDINN